MFFNSFVSAILAEALMLLIFRGYQKKSSVFVTSGIYMPLSIPISVLFSLWLNGQSYEQLLTTKPWISVLMCLGTIILGFAGAALGMKIAAELQKAGKLKPYGEDKDA
jgi:energy-coupling factor transport system substrate-specific component